jgi:CcmD family protein
MQTNPPDNGGYMVAAYVIVSLVVLLYGWSLARRAKRESER